MPPQLAQVLYTCLITQHAYSNTQSLLEGMIYSNPYASSVRGFTTRIVFFVFFSLFLSLSSVLLLYDEFRFLLDNFSQYQFAAHSTARSVLC